MKIVSEDDHSVMRYIVYLSQPLIKVTGQAWDKDKKYLGRNILEFGSSGPIIIEN